MVELFAGEERAALNGSQVQHSVEARRGVKGTGHHHQGQGQRRGGPQQAPIPRPCAGDSAPVGVCGPAVMTTALTRVWPLMGRRAWGALGLLAGHGLVRLVLALEEVEVEVVVV